jgi:PiT family inorganic phosphate transporter
LLLVTIVLYLALFFAVTLVAGNNLSACLGTAIGARIVSRHFAVILGAAGFILGLVTLGQNMTGATQALSSSMNGPLLITEILLTMVFIFLLGHFMKVPFSNSMSLLGVLVGISIGRGHVINQTYLDYAIALWIIAPVVAIFVMFLFVRFVISKSKPTDLWSRLRLLKILIIIASFLTAFASGTNSIAIIVAIPGFGIVELLIAIFAIIIGTIFLSAGQIRRVGTEIVMLRYSNAFLTLLTSASLILLANLSSIPLSSTQTLSASVFGAGLSYKHKLLSAKPFTLIMIGWIVVPLLSFAIGFLLSRV